jgi:sugar/nucleoside kinase (ribokinase family)
VDTRDIVLLPGQKTSLSYIFSNLQGGNQIYFYPGAAAAWQTPLMINHLASRQTRACLVTVGDPRTNREFVHQSIACGVPVFWQMKADIQAYPPEQLAELLSVSRVLFMNLTEAGYLMDTLGANKIEALQQHPQQVLALTLGSKGSRVYTQGRWSEIPVVPGTTFIDPTGAGDGYTAGFLAAWFKGYSPEICGRVGAVLASFVIEKTGCQTNLPDWKTLDGRYMSFFQQSLYPE